MTNVLTPVPHRVPAADQAPSLSRRGAVLAVVGGLGLSSVAASATAGTGHRARLRRRPLPTPARTATTASTLRNPMAAMVAVRVFPSYRTSVYQHHDIVLARLADLGVKRISHKLTPEIASNAAVISFTRRAYLEHGIKSWLTVGEPHKVLSADDWNKIVGVLTGPLAGMVERVYGWNEPNHVRNGGPLPRDWHLQTAAHQQSLWDRVSPLGIKVGTPPLWSGDFAKHDADLATLAPLLRGTFDHIGWHLYPRGGVGAELIDRFDATYRRALGTFPVVCTEAGHFTAPRYVGRAVNITEAEQSVYMPQLIDEYVKRGYGISYFELLDDPDPSGANREAHLGLCRTPSLDPATWQPKPAYAALRAHLATPAPRNPARRQERRLAHHFARIEAYRPQ